LESVQLSVQGATPGSSDPVAGRRSFLEKQAVARLVVAEGLVLTLNVVLHRHNLDDLDAIVDLALDWGADRLELANVQLYGWALANRAHLLPAAEQLSRASERFHRRRAELGDRLAMVWVRQDYLDGRPKPCMNGWGTTSMTVAPDGRVLPCPAATGIAGLRYDSVREHGLAWIWAESEAFNAFRGEDWMREPCRSCAFRHDDHGGCRCQTFALTGDATRTDPACRWSPDHHVVEEAVALAGSAPAGRRGWDGIRYRARADDRRRAGPSNGHGTDKGDRG
jgi:pyrroloquinoline quinone biosynthesis protein E